MPRLLYIDDLATGKRFGERDVTGLSEHDVIQIEIQMRCKWDLYGVFVDTETHSDLTAIATPTAPDNHQPE